MPGGLSIEIICIGKLGEAYYRLAQEEYAKRLTRYCKLSVREFPELPAPERLSDKQREQLLDREGEQLLSALSRDQTLWALDIAGETLSSEVFASRLNDQERAGQSIVFVIGGSLGLSEAVLSRAQGRISLSRMTFPHQMARILLLEQLYRGYRIIRNEPYHK